MAKKPPKSARRLPATKQEQERAKNAFFRLLCDRIKLAPSKRT